MSSPNWPVPLEPVSLGLHASEQALPKWNREPAEMTKFSDEVNDYTLCLVRETDAAWLCDPGEDSDALQVWLPKSQCEFPRGCKQGQVVEVTIPNWLAEERGLI